MLTSIVNWTQTRNNSQNSTKSKARMYSYECKRSNFSSDNAASKLFSKETQQAFAARSTNRRRVAGKRISDYFMHTVLAWIRLVESTRNTTWQQKLQGKFLMLLLLAVVVVVVEWVVVSVASVFHLDFQTGINNIICFRYFVSNSSDSAIIIILLFKISNIHL